MHFQEELEPRPLGSPLLLVLNAQFYVCKFCSSIRGRRACTDLIMCKHWCRKKKPGSACSWLSWCFTCRSITGQLNMTLLNRSMVTVANLLFLFAKIAAPLLSSLGERVWCLLGHSPGSFGGGGWVSMLFQHYGNVEMMTDKAVFLY